MLAESRGADLGVERRRCVREPGAEPVEKAGRKAVLVQITRDGSSRFVALPVANG